MKGEYVLILGQAKIGKTSAFKIIRKLKIL